MTLGFEECFYWVLGNVRRILVERRYDLRIKAPLETLSPGHKAVESFAHMQQVEHLLGGKNPWWSGLLCSNSIWCRCFAATVEQIWSSVLLFWSLAAELCIFDVMDTYTYDHWYRSLCFLIHTDAIQSVVPAGNLLKHEHIWMNWLKPIFSLSSNSSVQTQQLVHHLDCFERDTVQGSKSEQTSFI